MQGAFLTRRYYVLGELVADADDAIKLQNGRDLAATLQATLQNVLGELLDDQVFGSDYFRRSDGLILVGGCALNVKLNEELQARQDRPRYSVTTVHHGAAAELPTVACFARFRPTGPPGRLRE